MTISDNIHQLLIQGFNGQELDHLCFRLGIEYDDLPALGRSAKAQELVALMFRQNRLAELVAVGAELRPNLAWPDTSPAALEEAIRAERAQRRQNALDLTRPTTERESGGAQAAAADVAPAAHLAPAMLSDYTIWSEPHGEPGWIEIPAGPCWLGSEQGRENEQPAHQVTLDLFLIARFPITNAQYQRFVVATDYTAPEHWSGARIPTGYENHPVRHVSYYDALAYCRWLSEATGEAIGLPSEAQWEKAARGTDPSYLYPWGAEADPARANTAESARYATSPVDYFLEGASPFGVVDTCGNIWEWTRSIYRPYPYDPADGREGQEGEESRVLRGGAYLSSQNIARCSYRSWEHPDARQSDDGFRVIRQP